MQVAIADEVEQVEKPNGLFVVEYWVQVGLVVVVGVVSFGHRLEC